MLAGMSAESLATLDRALASPGISARHRARLLVLAARTHSILGEVEPRRARSPPARWRRRAEADDNWAMGWALHVLTLVAAVQGRMADALPMFDRALAVTQADPALTDLRLLLQINQAGDAGLPGPVRGGTSPRPGKPRDLADQVGTAIRLAQAHSAMGQLLFETGRWDDALAEVEILPENLQDTRCGLHAISALPRSSASIVARSTPRAVTSPLLSLTPSDRTPADPRAGPGAQPGPRAGRRAARGAGRADRRVRRRYRRTRGDRGPAGGRRSPRRPRPVI